jgi:hypothetical protein
MTDGSVKTIDLPEDETRVPYEPPSFSIAALSVITLGGTLGSSDSGNTNTQDPPLPGTGVTEDGFDEDPLGDPWSSRGGGGG